LAASVWSDNVNLALDAASKIKAGTVWVICTNQFDAAAGFGGYRESGYGREGGREGLFEYVKVIGHRSHVSGPSSSQDPTPKTSDLDVTHKLYIGGKQA